MKLEGKTALITGAGRNIGRATALLFAREGANVVVNVRANLEEAQGVVREIEALGRRAIAVAADVGDPDQVERLVQESLEHFGRVDVLVSNAGVRPHNDFLKISREEWRWVLATNLDATFYLCQGVLPGMIEQGWGTIVAISRSRIGRPQRPHVSASKQGMDSLIMAVAREMASHGIRANVVAPGSIESDRAHPEWYAVDTATPWSETWRNRIPMGRHGRPEEVADAILFLSCDDSSYITGQIIHVDGGFYMSAGSA